MAQALRLAENGRYTVSPNPMVGCVIVKHHRIIGQGYHQKAGGPHAEMIALQEAGSEARDAAVYVTLEPCCHDGRTPPCTRALIRAGIREIFIACQDPNKVVSGKGMHELREAGILVEVGLYEDQAKQLNEHFFHYITHQRPFVIAKWAMSLDGKTITEMSDTRDISCVQSRMISHQLRQSVDAILIGANTARLDNPQLTARYDTPIQKQPIRIVLSTRGDLPLYLKLFHRHLPSKTILVTTDQIDDHNYLAFTQHDIDVLILPHNKEAQVDLKSLLHELGKQEITSLLVEGGMKTHAQFFNEGLVNKIHVHLAPVIIASLKQKQSVAPLDYSEVGNDFHLIATVGDTHV